MNECVYMHTNRYINGEVYDGDFDGGIRSGQGTLLYPTGGQYSGGFRNDLRFGHGTLR